MGGKIENAGNSIEEAQRLAEELADKYLLGSALSAASNLEVYVNKDFAKADALREQAS